MLQRIDKGLLNVTQAIANWIEHQTGLTNFNIARFLAVAWCASVLGEAFRVTDLWLRIAWYSLAVVTPFLLVSMFWIIADLERQSRRGSFANQDKMFSISARYLQGGVTVAVCATSLVMMHFGPLDAGLLALWVHYYFRAYDRPPPKPVREPLFGAALEGGRS